MGALSSRVNSYRGSTVVHTIKTLYRSRYKWKHLVRACVRVHADRLDMEIIWSASRSVVLFSVVEEGRTGERRWLHLALVKTVAFYSQSSPPPLSSLGECPFLYSRFDKRPTACRVTSLFPHCMMHCGQTLPSFFKKSFSRMPRRTADEKR